MEEKKSPFQRVKEKREKEEELLKDSTIDEQLKYLQEKGKRGASAARKNGIKVVKWSVGNE